MLTYLLKKWLFYLWMLIPVSIFAEADNQYSNPVIGLNYSTADVCVWEKSGTYYLFHTTYFNHMHILESQNLVDWKDSKIDVFDNEILNLFQGYLNKHGIKDCFGGCKSIWAPHVVKIKVESMFYKRILRLVHLNLLVTPKLWWIIRIWAGSMMRLILLLSKMKENYGCFLVQASVCTVIS